MTTLVITDIPRLSALFERIAAERGNLAVVGEIHRGIEALDRLKPDLIIIQNYLSGLSADILHKHLKSRLNRRKASFALISPSDSLDVELSARFEAILDPTLPDEQLAQIVETLLSRPARATRPVGPPVTSILDLPPIAAHEPELPGLSPDPAPVPPQPPVDTVLFSSPPATTTPVPSPLPPTTEEQLPEPATYDLPRRPNRSIISAFSQHLDSTAEELQPQPAAIADRDDPFAIRDLHREPHTLGEDDDTAPPPILRRTSFWLVAGTVILVVLITLVQQRPRAPRQVSIPQPPGLQAPLSAERPAAVPPVTAPSSAAVQGRLQSHGQGRPKTLPAFIPQNGFDPAYAKDNPGWESYHGQTNEYRVFREKDGSIKAIQVIDRSGAGIQDAFYISILKGLAGVTAMRPTSSEIKEGYEIRRGTVAGLDVVQYRDAQGGRLRGVVITWP